MYVCAVSQISRSMLYICLFAAYAFSCCLTVSAQDYPPVPEKQQEDIPPANQEQDPSKTDQTESVPPGNQDETQDENQNNQQQQNQGVLPPIGPPLPGQGNQAQNQGDPGQEPVLPNAPAEIFVNEEYAGWRQAGIGVGGIQLDETIRSNWVMLGPNGKLSGQVLSFDGTEFCGEDGFVVHLVSKGQTVGSARTDEQGRFEMNGIEPGTYTLSGLSFHNFIAFGFNAIGYQEGATKLQGTLQCIAIPRFGKLLGDLVKQNAPKVDFRVFGTYKLGEGEDDPPRLYGLEGIAVQQPDAIPSTSMQAHRVGITPDGRFLGRIHQINNLNGRPVEVLDTSIYLIRENVILARAKTDYYGVFEFKNMRPGFYGIVAAGKDGFAAIGVEVVPQSNMQSQFEQPYQLNSPRDILASVVRRVASNSEPIVAPFDIALSAPENIGWINHKVQERVYAEVLADKTPKVWRPAYWAIDEGFLKIPLGPDGRPLMGNQMRPAIGCPWQVQYPGGGWAYGPICEADYWVGCGYGNVNGASSGFGHYHGFGLHNSAHCGSCGGGYGDPYYGAGFGYDGGFGYGGGYGGFDPYGYGGYGYGGYGSGGYGAYGTGRGTFFDVIDGLVEQSINSGIFGFARPNTFGGLTPEDLNYFTPGGLWPNRFAMGPEIPQDPNEINYGPFNKPLTDRNYWQRDPREGKPISAHLIGNQNPNAPENIRDRRREQLQKYLAEGGMDYAEFLQLISNTSTGSGYRTYGSYSGFDGYGQQGFGNPGFGYPPMDYRANPIPNQQP